MGLRRLPDDNLPPGVTSADPHFYDIDCCPECYEPTGDEVFCQSCGAVLDPDEAAAYDKEQER